MRAPAWIAVACMALLAACGGAGGSAPPTQRDFPAPPPGQPAGTAPDAVLVEPHSVLDLPALLATYGGLDLGPVGALRWHRIRIPGGQTPVGYLTALEGDARVAAAELDLGLRAPEGDGRTIPAGGTLRSIQLPTQEPLQRIGLGAAAGRATGVGVRVAVLDTGVVSRHPYLAQRLADGGYDFVRDDPDPEDERDGADEDGDGLVDEGHAHGTSVASIVLAIAPDVRILPVRVLGADLVGRSSAVAAGISHAASIGVDVIHLSIDLPDDVRIVRDAIEQARALGVAVIASAGNTGVEDVDPATGAFVVTAVDEQDVRAGFASYGAGVDLAAPGVQIHGAYPDTDPDTARWDGTSFAAPIASGAFALLRELRPLDGPDALLERLRATATPIDAQNPAVAGGLGAGRIDLDAATTP